MKYLHEGTLPETKPDPYVEAMIAIDYRVQSAKTHEPADAAKMCEACAQYATDTLNANEADTFERSRLVQYRDLLARVKSNAMFTATFGAVCKYERNR